MTKETLVMTTSNATPTNYEELVAKLAKELFDTSKDYLIPQLEEKYQNWEDLISQPIGSSAEFTITKYRVMATDCIEFMREHNIIDSEKWKFDIVKKPDDKKLDLKEVKEWSEQDIANEKQKFDVNQQDNQAESTFDNEVTANFKTRR